jgi:phage terminase Nu1 subunit (DNA packaging protein)
MMVQSLPSALVNEHKAAEILGLRVATLRRWRWAGSPLPYRKIGNAVRYDPADLTDFIEAGRRTSTSEGKRPIEAG